MTHYTLQRSIYVINVDILSRKNVTYYVMLERSMATFGDVVDAYQLSIVRPITSTIREFANFMLVVRDLLKDRLVVGISQKRNAWRNQDGDRKL